MKVLVVDDEPVARRVILRFMQDDPDVTEVTECTNGEQAREHLRNGGVDIVFLDVQMPGIDGFEALEGRREVAPLAVILVTAYEEHALRAIDVGVAAYLLKPFDRDRFTRAFDRAKVRLHQERLLLKSEELAQLLSGRSQGAPSPVEYSGRVAVSEGPGFRMVATDEIRWVESADKHVVIHTTSGEQRARMTLSDLEGQLDPRLFLRVHRCNIVALDQIAVLQQTQGGAPYLELVGGERVVVSRSRAQAVRAALRGRA